MLHFISDAAPRRHRDAREGELREAHLRLIKMSGSMN